MSNYEEIQELVLRENRSEDEIIESLDLLAGQPSEVRAFASDSSHTVRLLLDRHGANPLGIAILARCGPEAADVLYEPAGYGSQAEEKEAALVVMRCCGNAGLTLTKRYKGWEPWHVLLRRVDPRDRATEPLLARALPQAEPVRSGAG